MPKILYVANVRMPTEKAHGIQIAKTCEAFAKAGADVALIVPDRKTPIREDVATYYGLAKSFAIQKIPVPDIVSWGRIGFFVESLFFGMRAAREARRGLVYGRDEIVLAIIRMISGEEVVWESHTGAWNLFARYVASRARRIVVISNGLKDFYISKGIPVEKIIVAHDAIDRAAFDNPESKKDARARLRLSQNAKIAMYIGAMGMWKGTDTLLEASTILPDDIQIAIISNSTFETKKYPRVLFLGEKPYKEIASNQAAADVLILPTSARDIVGARFTSPLKLFTYAASGVPIVASDVPSAKEILSEDAAYWFEPDTVSDLVRAIKEALSDPTAHEKAAIAKREVSLYTWDERAKRILSHI